MWRARADLLPHRAGDDWLLVDPRDDRVHSLNATAFWIWRMCDGVVSEQQLAQRLAEETRAAVDVIAASVRRALESLASRALIEPVVPTSKVAP